MTWIESKEWAKKNTNVIFFVGGFLFDALTIIRIDSLLDLLIQAFYLAMITIFLIQQIRLEKGLWQPGPFVSRFWHYETEIIHFFYGGLLSAYVILYFKSTTGPRSFVFLGLTFLLMFANEMPQVKEAGSRLRLGLHAFCLVSFLNYLIPIIFGRMGVWTFALAVIVTAIGSYYLVKYIAGLTPDNQREKYLLGWAPAVALSLVVGLYVLKWIPPVPLSMQYAGIFHKIEREGTQFRLTYPKPPFYMFWKKDSRPFLAREHDVAYCFVRVFAPRRFTQQIYMQWSVQDPVSKKYTVADRIPLAISGGRGEGFRGYGAKSNYSPGRYRVEVMTNDDRVIGQISFEIKTEEEQAEREWRSRLM